MVQWLAPLPHNKKILGLSPRVCVGFSLGVPASSHTPKALCEWLPVSLGPWNWHLIQGYDCILPLAQVVSMYPPPSRPLKRTKKKRGRKSMDE